jgi:hypothetical protein
VSIRRIDLKRRKFEINPKWNGVDAVVFKKYKLIFLIIYMSLFGQELAPFNTMLRLPRVSEPVSRLFFINHTPECGR